MPRTRSQENKLLKLRKTKPRNSKKPLERAYCSKQNVIKKCFVRVKSNYGQSTSKITNNSTQDVNIQLNPSSPNQTENMTSLNEIANSEAQNNSPYKIEEILISDSSSDEDDPSQSLFNNNDQTSYNSRAPSPNKTKSNVDENKSKIYGFIGLEYVAKVFESSGKATRYECVLCELNLGFNDMQKHLLSHSHRLKYCEQHFPSAIQQLRELISKVPKLEQYKVMVPMLQKLAVAIEKHHGRAQLFECDKSQYQKNRKVILSKVFLRFHFSEHNGPTFIGTIDSKEVNVLISQLNSYNPQETTINVPIFDNLKSFVTTKETKLNIQIPKGSILKIGNEMRTHFQMSQPFFLDVWDFAQTDDEQQPCIANLEQTHQTSQHCLANDQLQHQQHYLANDQLQQHQHCLANLESQPSSQSQQIIQHENAELLTSSKEIWGNYCQRLNILNEHYQLYKRNPQSYPAYNQELSKFYHNRSAELMATGKDYLNHDYHTDWLEFFNDLLKKQYIEGFETSKLQFRNELPLPLTNDFVLESNYYVNVGSTEHEMREDYAGSCDQPISVDLTNSPEPFEINDNETPTFVPLLGLLVALEEHLGSMAPKVLDLLTRAIIAEKLGQVHTLITVANCNLLETVMEKFKGLIIVDIVDNAKLDALKKAIDKVGAFLEAARKVL